MHNKLGVCALLALVLAFGTGQAVAGSQDDGFLLLQGGTFAMGSPVSERQRQMDEEQHDVTLSSFYVDPCEVRQGDYEAVMKVNPSTHKGENLPVENVTWLDAVR